MTLTSVDETALRLIHSKELGDLPSYYDIGKRAGFADGDEVAACIDRLVLAGCLYQICCGEEVGLYVRLPEEEGSDKRLTTWTGDSWRDLMTGSTDKRGN